MATRCTPLSARAGSIGKICTLRWRSARSGAAVVPLPLRPPYDSMTLLTFGGTLGPPPGSWVPAVPFSTLTTIDATGGVRNELTGDYDRDLGNRSLVLFDSGDEIVVEAGEEGIRFLLVSGRPIEEPVAWYGPIVMNTQEELRQAMRELQLGTFIR